MGRAYPILVADIGGTHARFGLVHGRAQSPEQVKSLRGEDFPSLESALASYLASVSEHAPCRGCIAVAGPVKPGQFILTNRPGWNTSLAALKAAHRLDVLDVINDFQALAEALPLLRADEMWPIGAPRAGEPRASLAVVGPGTGLGVGAAIETEAGWQAVPGEGGHVEIASPDRRAREVIARLAGSHGRVSAERLLSGPGLSLLHRTLGEIEGSARDARDASAIAEAAAAGEREALDTVSTFLNLLASFAGDVALMFGAKGGLFLAGGVAARLKQFIEPEAFRRGFENKGRLQPYLAAIPTSLISVETLALRGCAAHLDRVRPLKPALPHA